MAGLAAVALSDTARLALLCIGIFATGLGYVLYTQTITAWFKNLLPEGSYGQFEGIRMVCAVCLPMIIGPAIATRVINGLGVPAPAGGPSGMIPSGWLFTIAAVLTLLILVPLVPLHRCYRRRKTA